jgi:hypothetical protein
MGQIDFHPGRGDCSRQLHAHKCFRDLSHFPLSEDTGWPVSWDIRLRLGPDSTSKSTCLASANPWVQIPALFKKKSNEDTRLIGHDQALSRHPSLWPAAGRVQSSQILSSWGFSLSLLCYVLKTYGVVIYRWHNSLRCIHPSCYLLSFLPLSHSHYQATTDLFFSIEICLFWQAMVVHTCNPSTWKAEAGGLQF